MDTDSKSLIIDKLLTHKIKESVSTFRGKQQTSFEMFKYFLYFSGVSQTFNQFHENTKVLYSGFNYSVHLFC